MIIPDLNSRLTESVQPYHEKPSDEVREPFLDAYMHALSNVKEEAKRMMSSKSKSERRDGLGVYSAVREFTDYLEKKSRRSQRNS